MTFLGIDLGTSEVKVLLLDDAHAIVGVSTAPLEVSRPHPMWSEQDPQSWWEATLVALGGLREAHPAGFSQIAAIGLSGQMHGAVLLDEQDRVLRPAILWNDGRSHGECEELTRLAPELHAIAGNLAMPGFTAPKLLWVKNHEPALFAQVRSVLLPKDWLRLRLCGEKISEPSDAAGTLWLDVARRDWSDELLAATGLFRDQMPRLVESCEPAGVLADELASEWGLHTGVLIAGGAGDNAASAIGIGAVEPGDGFLSLGTSGVLFVVNDRFRPNPASAVHAFCHALPARWHQMSVMLSAASCLKWYVQVSGAQDESALLDEVQTLSDEARDTAPIFLPYLGGERTPHNTPFATGVFHGLRHDTTRGACAYAVLEGVAFGMADGLQALGESGGDVRRLSLVGGGARSGLWAQLMADVLGVEIVVHAGSLAGAALGAARLAWMAVGGSAEQVCTRPPVAATYLPQEARQPVLQSRLRRYRKLYQCVQPLEIPAG